ncbi:hypothetical protein [Daejeonella lutea]|uniref:Uncharacterized protein n=1 Tax=Daejeonella lutea TaxID=572036 RepID=A0A1T5B106_9SPHI|nr:hypothetical protein [Daejeonella lutea]SKB40660.1 hypothetical protein SAMN05661099_1172 [Daejeonella lutea]
MLNQLSVKNLNYIYIVPYITICGALFHVTFWDKFDVNGLAFISISDIIKSSVYPIFSVLLVVVYNLAVQNLILPSSADGSIQASVEKKPNNLTLLILYFSGKLVALFLFYLTNTTKDPTNFIIYGALDAIFVSIFLVNNNFLRDQFMSERLRRFAIDLIVFIPIVSYYSGKYSSEIIYQNIKYRYSVNQNKSSADSTHITNDTLKFIGKAENHLVFTDLKNTKIVMVRTEGVDTITFFIKK